MPVSELLRPVMGQPDYRHHYCVCWTLFFICDCVVCV